MTYEEYKTFLGTFLWKGSDVVLVQNLDNLIKMADAELNRRLKIQDREDAAVLDVSSEEVLLPGDYHALRDVSSSDPIFARGEWYSRTPAQIRQLRAETRSAQYQPYYAIQHNKLLLCGPFSSESPYRLTVQYWKKVPDFATEDQSFLAENFLDLYTYACLKQSAMFLREDERVQAWVMMFNEALESALEDNAHNRARAVMDGPGPVRISSSRR